VYQSFAAISNQQVTIFYLNIRGGFQRTEENTAANMAGGAV